MKVCNSCQTSKPISEFGKNKSRPDGLTQWCKPCRNDYQRKWRDNNVDHVREANRQSKRDERKRKGKQHFRDAYNKWYQNNKEHKREYVAERRKKDKKKIKAQNKLNKAIQMGKIIRPPKCDHCGKNKKVDGHHHDYDKPFDVVWLCRSCHMTEHSKYL